MTTFREAPQPSGSELIAVERQRQIDAGDEWVRPIDRVMFARALISIESLEASKSPVNNLVAAAAALAAEIDRLQRQVGE